MGMRPRLLPLALLGVCLAAACSSNTSSSSTTTAKATTTTRASTTTTSKAVTTTTAGTVQCRFASLSISAGQANGAAGHSMVPIDFKNTGATSCTMFGFPGVASLTSSGAQAAQATRSTTPAPARITLAPGASGSALVTATDVPSGTLVTCPTWAGLLVTPPNDTQSARLTVQLPGCPGFSVGPVVAGTAGM